jgi:Uma2 family endonuclease
MTTLLSRRQKLQRAVNRDETVADLLRRLGGISPKRIRLHPPPGKATERDVVWLDDHEDRLYELEDGVLVEKVMGALESFLTCALIRYLEEFVADRDLGAVLGEAGMLRLAPRRVRIPDISFISWDRIPSGEFPQEPIPDLVPDLAVEVISKGNTKREMERKVREYFEAGVRLVWLIDPKTRTARVFTSPHNSTVLGNGKTLDGGDVLPGFALPLKTLFGRAKRKSS